MSIERGHSGRLAALVVFDRVVSADPEYRKFWLLHTQEQPRIGGASAVVDCTRHDQRGRLTLDVLLPGADNRQLAGVGEELGGAWFEAPAGTWRLEISN